ncbi:hypothetical protein [Amycolatopsis xylanica]|uniref:hypothetical protein n=1 Tax=Amycolatopsis xylanica TaxID=589385 RepID=UPI00115F878B|nr:hypothetical protein [Amycolatopsis xylanica]
MEEYLRALWALGRDDWDREAWSEEAFVEVVTGALSSHVPQFDEVWRSADFVTGLGGWERVILSQVVELRDIEAGADAGRWNNLSVATYLECAMAAALDGVGELPPRTGDQLADFLIHGQRYE